MTTRAAHPLAPHPERAAWWRECFEDSGMHRTAPQVRARAEGAARFLQLDSRSRVLDLCCGLGEEAIELARRGHRVLGMDDTDEDLRAARAGLRDEKLLCHFVKGDMRNIPYSGEFDAVLARQPAFGRFSKERDDLKCLESVRKALKPGGRLLLRLVNRDWVMRHLPLVGTEAGVRFDFHAGRLEVGHRPARGFRLYALTEVHRLLGAAGLAFRHVWGRYDGASYGLDCLDMIVLAEKPRETRPRRRDAEDELPRALKIKGRGR